MATGEIRQASRPLFYTDERLDAVDANALAVIGLTYADFLTRNLIATPRATGGTAPTGIIFTGGSVTVNPTAPNDGLIQINAEVFVGIDADGRPVIKSAAAGTLRAGVPMGAQRQLYLYWKHVPGATATRRFITAVQPYTEQSTAVNTVDMGDIDIHFEIGNAGNIQFEAAINGITSPLIFLGLVTNVAGVVTYDGSAVTNRLSTIFPPAIWPLNGTSNGSMATLQDMTSALGYMIAVNRWKGSTHKPGGNAAQAIGNNYWAYSEPPAGLDLMWRKTFGYTTIGNRTNNQHGDFDVEDFASGDVCLQAAFDSLPAQGGIVVIKPQTVVGGWASAVTVAPGKHITVIGADNPNMNSAQAQLQMVDQHIWFPGPGLMPAATPGSLTLRNIAVSCFGKAISLSNNKFVAEGCFFQQLHAAAPSPAVITGDGWLATKVDGVQIRNCLFIGVPTGSSFTNPAFINTGSLPASNVVVENSIFVFNNAVERMVHIGDARRNVRFSRCDFFVNGDLGAGTSGVGIFMSSTVNDQQQDCNGRIIESCTFKGSLTHAGAELLIGVTLDSISYVTIDKCDFQHCAAIGAGGIYIANANGMTGLQVLHCNFLDEGGIYMLNGAGSLGATKIVKCRFDHSDLTLKPAQDLIDLLVDTCEFDGGGATLNTMSLSCRAAYQVRILNNIYKGANFVSNPYLTTASDATGLAHNIDFAGNIVRDFRNSASDDAVLGFEVDCYGGENISIRDNSFYELQNGAYNGLANDNGRGGARVIQVRGAGVGQLLITGNRVWNVQAAGWAGATLCVARHIRLTSHINNTEGGTWAGVIIQGNAFGNTASACVPLTTDRITLQDLNFLDNVCRYRLPGGITYPRLGDFHMELTTNTFHAKLAIRGNTFYLINGTGAALDRNAVCINGTNVGNPRSQNGTITDNLFNVNVLGWHIANKRGFQILNTGQGNFVFFNNIAIRDDLAPPNGNFQLNWTAGLGPQFLQPSGFALVDGMVFPQNLGITYKT